MKYKFILPLCLIFSLSVNAETIYQEKDIHLDPTTNTMFDQNNQSITGTLKVAFKDGKIQKEIPYENGLKNGTETWYWPNGTKRFIVHWKDGLYNGTLEEYRQDGTPRMLRTYLNGIKEGKEIHYHINGEQRWSITYKDGKEYVEEQRYASGEKFAEYPENDDSGEFKVYYKNGNLKYLGTADKEKKTGTATFFYRTGGKAFEMIQDGEKVSGKIYALSGKAREMSEDEIKLFQFNSGFGFFTGPDKGWDDKLIRGFMR